MATAVKSQIVPLPGCSQTKPPVPPKPLPGEEKKSVKKKSDHNVLSESPLGLGEIGHLNQAIVLAQQLRLKNSNTVSETSEDKGPESKPSTSQTTDSAKKPAPGVKRSQSTDAKPKPKYVLKPLRQHHSFQEKMKKPHVDKRTTRDDTTSSKIRDWFCLPLASFVVKTKDGGTSLIEKGKGRLFGKGPGPPKKLKRPAPNPPRGEENLSIPSRPKVPPRPVLQRILADIDNGKGAGKWHKLENVKYVDEEVTTEDSTDYSDVDWGQAIHSAPGEESIIYFTYIEEGPNERVIFYRSVRRDEVVSSSEDDDADDDNKRTATTTSRHVAEMEDMEIDDYELIELAKEVALLTSVQMNGKPEVENNSKDFQDLNDSKDEEQSVDKQIPPIEVEVMEVTRSHSPEMHKNLSIIVEEEEAVKSSPPPRPPSPKYPPPAKSSSPIFPLLSRSPSPKLKMLSRTPSPKPDITREQSPVIIYEKFETKVKVVEKNIPITDTRLPLIEREMPAVTTHLPTENVEKNEPAYARVQKYSPPKNEITEISEIPKINENLIENVNEPIITKSEPYYDLDVADSAPKVKPKRPPRPAPPPPPPPPPKVVPPPPPKIAPPPVPPKTYMMVQFPPPLMKKEIEQLEKFENIDEAQPASEPVFEVMEVVSKVELGVEMNGNFPEKDDEIEKEIQIEKEITEQVEIDVKLEKDISEEIKDENIVADSFKQEEEANNNNNNTDNNNFHLKSHLSLGESEMSDDKLRSTSALVLNETSESGFMSSPTPPPRHRRKRFRSMEGPSRGSIEDVGIPIPLRRSKSISGSENRESWPNSEKSATPSASKEKLDAPKPPQRPNIRPKPARPPKPKITVVKQLAQQPSMVSSEPDLHSLISSNGGSPPLIVMKARPLPPPPTPPRHRFPMKSSDRESNVASKTPPIPISSNFPYEFLAKLSEIEAGKLSLNEINVKRINVQEIEADVIRAGSLQVGVISPLVSVSKDDKDGDGDKKGEESKKDENNEKCQDGGGGGENDQVCPKENEKDVQESDKGIEDTDQKLCQEVIEEMVKDTLLRDSIDDVKAEKEGDKEDKFMKVEQVTDPFTEPPVAFPSELGSSTFYLNEDQPDKSRSPTPSSTNGGKSSKKNRERKTSWYDEGVVPGQSGDVDTSDGRAEGSTDSPTLIKQLETNPEPHKSSLISLANRSSDRKKPSKVGRGSLQLYPREESPSSSSTTDAEVDEQKTRHHRGSRSRSLSAGYSMERQMPQLDPNANYCVDQVPNANLNKQCPGNGQCDSPPQSRKELATMMEDVEASPKFDRFSNVHDATKRLSLLSIPTSEDSWYNCTSGDESESESSFSTAASCQDNSSSVSVVTDVRRTKKYFIARELMSSERVFVDALKLLNEDFRNVVKEANAKTDQKVIPVAVLDQILNYLPQLHNLNQDLLKDLQERIKNWEQMGRIADVITKKGPFLKLYSAYIKDFEMITSSLDEACKKYPLFAQVVKDFEMSDRCNKLALKHFMLKPVQRIPQYKLILHEYLKHVNSDSPEHEETVAALKIVTDVANHANQAMKQGDNFAKLLHIQNSIIGGGYEVIRPGRLFLREGELSKLSRKVMQPRWFILFNDALLHTDVNQGSLRLHHELPLSAMRVVVPTNEEHLNEFSVISSTRSFTLSANSLQERDEWVSALNNAIKANAQRRGTFALAVDKTISPHDDVDFTLGKNAPVWIPDVRVTMCQCCITPFTVTFRRHHCRACGKVVCATCSANRAPLQYLKFQSARVCDECFFRLAEAFDNTPSESDCSTERASQSESGDVNTSDIQRANIKAQFKRYATSGGKKMERRLPRVLKEVGANHQGAAISGYLNKKTKKGWRRYWFVINDKVLYTYKASEDVAALESIPLLGFKLESNFEVFEGGDSNLGFQLIHPNHHSLIFCGENEDATEKWKKEMHLATLLE